jgi:glycerol-3-phosphate acyltransferase PlsY
MHKNDRIDGEVKKMKMILAIALGYILGSIPFALVIGKVFYHTDVRKYGSGNLGGTNAGRVLGKKVGAIVILLDALKVVLAMGLACQISVSAGIWAGTACCIGHCFPVFAHFKGGKAVASSFGFFLSLWIFIFHDPRYFLLPLLMFLVVLYLFKFVSLGSICALLFSALYITGTVWNIADLSVIAAAWIMTILVIYRHKANIGRIRSGTENKISWL